MKNLNQRKYYIVVILFSVLLIFALALFCSCTVKSYDITYSADEGGAIGGIAIQTVKEGEDGTEVTAVPSEGYIFIKWSDGVTEATRQEKNVNEDIMVTAIFHKLLCTVNFQTDGNGTIKGKDCQTIKYGEWTEIVTAIPNVGYRFVRWSNEYPYAQIRHMAYDDIIITAIFEKIFYTVEYKADGNGTIKGETIQTVMYEDNAKVITAIPKDGFVFVKWSDGVTTAERQDCNITENLNLTAYFGFCATYRANNNDYGTIIGNTSQSALSGEYYESVTAVANPGFVFSGWSDLNCESTRRDIGANNSFDLVAYFEPIEKVFKYDYGIAKNMSTATYVVLNRNRIQETEFVVPQFNGYIFEGWYADSKYKLKVVNADGLYMLGYSGFMLDSDTLYAKWKKDDEETDLPVHKILLVFIDSVEATLYSSKTEKDIDINYKMSGIERAFCMAIPERISFYLNDWFDGIATFEVDSYYTMKTVEETSFSSGRNSFGHVNYAVYGQNIPEIGNLLNNYHNVLTMVGMNDYDYLLHGTSGVSTLKYSCIYMEGSLRSYIENKQLETVINDLRCGKDSGNATVYVYLHEFTHTCEQYYNYTEIMEYHKTIPYIDYISGRVLEPTRLYLLGKMEIEGEVGGIPMEYWKHEIEIPVTYSIVSINGGQPGYIVNIGNEEDRNPIKYGGSIKVEAIPYEGFLFVKWSDGVDTAIRHDTNIISYLSVYAIFEKIN